MLSKLCPACQTTLSIKELWQFTTPWGTRKTGPCPNCGDQLIWATGPWRATSAAGAVGTVAIVLDLLSIGNFPSFATTIVVLASSLVGILAARSQRFIRVYPLDPLPRIRGVTTRKPATSSLGPTLALATVGIIAAGIVVTLVDEEPIGPAILLFLPLIPFMIGIAVITVIVLEFNAERWRQLRWPLLVVGVGLVVGGNSAFLLGAGTLYYIGLAVGSAMTLGGLGWAVRNRLKARSAKQLTPGQK